MNPGSIRRRLSPRRSFVTVGIALLIILALTATLAVLGGCAREKKSATLYHCPMHPNYISDHPGDCPICGMRLVPVKSAAEAGEEGAGANSAKRIGGRTMP